MFSDVEMDSLLIPCQTQERMSSALTYMYLKIPSSVIEEIQVYTWATIRCSLETKARASDRIMEHRVQLHVAYRVQKLPIHVESVAAPALTFGNTGL